MSSADEDNESESNLQIRKLQSQMRDMKMIMLKMDKRMKNMENLLMQSLNNSGSLNATPQQIHTTNYSMPSNELESNNSLPPYTVCIRPQLR